MKIRSINTSLVPIEQLPFEVVERKGIGHPDTLADGIAETISLAYSAYCLDHFGAVLHHNTDKTAIFGGLAEIGLGSARMIKPHRAILSGRISADFGGVLIDYEELQGEATRKWLNESLPALDVGNSLEIHSFTSSSSRSPVWYHPRDLQDVPDITQPWANDTSVCVGYWPLSLTEQMTLALEGYFYANGKAIYDFIGQDIKVMSVRSNDSIEVTMCVPFMAAKIPNLQMYEEWMCRFQDELLKCAEAVVGNQYNITLHVNTQDQRKNDIRGRYFVCSGTALDFGEEGMVGRGNRSRGVISSVRPYSMEASNGKNPVYHVGKVFGYVVDVLSKKIAETFSCECQLAVATRMGDPLFDPYQVFVWVSEDISKNDIFTLIDTELATRQWTHEILTKKPFLPRPGGGHGIQF